MVEAVNSFGMLIATAQVSDHGGLDQGSSGKGGNKYLDLRQILSVANRIC